MKFKGELFEASHPPLVSKKLFDIVQDVLEKKAKPIRKGEVKFSFTGLMKCGECGASITAERQKGHAYYRCTKKLVRCSQKFLREEALLSQINKAILKVFIDNDTKDKMIARFSELAGEESKASSFLSRQAQDELKAFDDRIERLIDLYIAKEISQEEYQRKKAKLVNDKKDLQERLGEIEKISGGWLEPSKNFLTTCNSASSVAWQGNSAAKRDFLNLLGSNFILKDRSLSFTTRRPFDLLAERPSHLNWLPFVDVNRNSSGLVPQNYFPLVDVNRNSSGLAPQNYFPLMGSKRKTSDKVATLLVPMFKRRGRAGMIRLGEPFPAKPLPPRPVYRNIIREALNIKGFLTENPQRTYIDAGQHFHLTRARISQLMKIVHELPAPFIEKMRSCDNQDALRAFSGKTLLRIADFRTEKERQRAIDTAFQQIEERKYQIALADPETCHSSVSQLVTVK